MAPVLTHSSGLLQQTQSLDPSPADPGARVARFQDHIYRPRLQTRPCGHKTQDSPTKDSGSRPTPVSGQSLYTQGTGPSQWIQAPIPCQCLAGLCRLRVKVYTSSKSAPVDPSCRLVIAEVGSRPAFMDLASRTPLSDPDTR